jgi:hypothetical protein
MGINLQKQSVKGRKFNRSYVIIIEQMTVVIVFSLSTEPYL